MFAKLLKHEWRATQGVLALLCVILLISGLASGLSLRALAMADGNEVVIEENAMYVTDAQGGDLQRLEILCVILATTGMFAIGFCCLGAIFVFLSRFYKRCFTDEGYLTFTLPVNSHQILLSGIVNTVLGMLVVAVAAVLGVGLIFGLFLTAIPQEIIWTDVWVSLKEIVAQILESLHKNAGVFLRVGISVTAGAFATLIELMLAVTIGALIAKKHKILAAVAAYYGINVVLGTVSGFLATTAVASQDLNWMLGSAGMVSCVAAVGGYFLMHWLISKKLNLT